VKLQLPSSVEEEERVDYSEDKEDLHNNAFEEGKGGPLVAIVKEEDGTQVSEST